MSYDFFQFIEYFPVVVANFIQMGVIDQDFRIHIGLILEYLPDHFQLVLENRRGPEPKFLTGQVLLAQDHSQMNRVQVVQHLDDRHHPVMIFRGGHRHNGLIFFQYRL